MVSISLKVTIPDTKFAKKKWEAEISRTQRQTSVPRLKKLFQKTVFGWSNKPDFGWTQTRVGDDISLTMYPTGEHADIWNLVNAGSPPHPINARAGGLLSFRPGYRAATRPGSIQSQRAYRSGKTVGAKRIPRHPGFPARDFIPLIIQEYENPFLNDMQDAINKVART